MGGTMRLLGQAAHALRVIGRLLDSENAHHAKIVHSKEQDVEISWERAGQEESRSYSELDIERLRAQAPLGRGAAAKLPQPGEREELMRTLGQELDALGVVVS